MWLPVIENTLLFDSRISPLPIGTILVRFSLLDKYLNFIPYPADNDIFSVNIHSTPLIKSIPNPIISDEYVLKEKKRMRGRGSVAGSPSLDVVFGLSDTEATNQARGTRERPRRRPVAGLRRSACHQDAR